MRMETVRWTGALAGAAFLFLACGGGGKDGSSGSAAAAPAVAVAQDPAVVDLIAGETQTVTATVSGSANTSVTWTVDNVPEGNSTVGIISGSGNTITYTAPSLDGTHILTATSVADPTKKGSSTCRVRRRRVSVSLSPSSATLITSGQQTFTATVSGSTNTGVSWAVDGTPNGNSTVGTLSGSGSTVTYTAPSSAGSHTLTATSAADATVQASASISVQSAPPPPTVSVSLTPAAVSLAPGAAQTFTAKVSGSANTSVSWSVDGIGGGNSSVGTIAGSANTATYTAPALAGSHEVRATSVADTSKSASSSVSVQHPCTPSPAASLVVNAMDSAYGVKGDGIANDTAALQRAVNAVAGTGGTLWIPAGTYLVDALTSLKLKSNMTLQMDPAAVLQAIPNGSSSYAILTVGSASYVNVVGGILLGERSKHTGTSGEWGFGLAIKSSDHVVVEGVTAKECWGDGFYVGLASKNITICNVVADHNRRQGISVTSADSIVVRNSTFKNTEGTAPEAGIDVEPNGGETVSNMLITGCSLINNAGGGISGGVPGTFTGTAHVINLVIDGNTVTGNGPSVIQSGTSVRGIEVTNCSGTQVTNNVVSGNTGYGILFRNGANNTVGTGNMVTTTVGDGFVEYSCSGNTITGNTVTYNTRRGIYSTDCVGSTITGNTVYGNGVP